MNRAKPPFEQRCARAVRLGFIHGVICAALLVVFVIATGSTFGQRCERANPGASKTAYDACVDRVSHGGEERL